jgi:energy-coupling factor transporter ATP-binding protein EcfA2
MAAIEFEDATKKSAKARIALAGPSGSGKTWTGLLLGCYLAAAEGGQLAVIDTERKSAAKYAGENGWRFKHASPQTFAPESLIEALGVAAGGGYPAVLIDSWSHYWMGVDGMLEQVDRRTAASRSNSSYSSGWKDMAPIERRMVDAIVSYPGHVIATLRVKTEYVIEKDERGKSKPVKVGMKPQQREGLEYEFDLVGDLDSENTLTVSKTRIPMLNGAVIAKPGEELAVTIRDWLADGEEVAGPLSYRTDALNKDATVASLRELLATVKTAGMGNAPVTDGEGNPTVLEALVVARGRALAAVLNGAAQ